MKLCKVMLDNEVLHKLVESILVHAVIKGNGDIASNRYDCFKKYEIELVIVISFLVEIFILH